jgi:hypothetical protein
MSHNTLEQLGINLIRLDSTKYLIVRKGYKSIAVKAAFEGQALLAARKLYNF